MGARLRELCKTKLNTNYFTIKNMSIKKSGNVLYAPTNSLFISLLAALDKITRAKRTLVQRFKYFVIANTSHVIHKIILSFKKIIQGWLLQMTYRFKKINFFSGIIPGKIQRLTSVKSTAICFEIFTRAWWQEPGPDNVRRTRWAIVIDVVFGPIELLLMG
jgi:hypothetical protein